MSESVELLTTDGEGRAVPGRLYPLDLSVVRYLPDEPTPVEPVLERTRYAYAHKFFRLDDDGQPMPETLVRFLVPEDLCDGAAPSRTALRLVAERMAWTD